MINKQLAKCLAGVKKLFPLVEKLSRASYPPGILKYGFDDPKAEFKRLRKLAPKVRAIVARMESNTLLIESNLKREDKATALLNVKQNKKDIAEIKTKILNSTQEEILDKVEILNEILLGTVEQL